MELLNKNRFALIFAIILTSAGCSKDPDLLTSNESVNQRFNQSKIWNDNHPFRQIVVASEDYSVLAGADSHVGSTVNLDSFFRIAETSHASAVVMPGDLTNGKKEDWDIFEQHLPDHDSLALFLIAGNHDLHFGGWEEFFTRFGSTSYLFTIKTPSASDLYICLDTAEGTLGDQQLNWLTNILETMRQNYRHCFVITHNNFFRTRQTESTVPLVEEMHVLIELFTMYHVDMVISGHDHLRYNQLFGITRYIVLDPLKDETSNAGYFQLNVKNGAISYKFENI
jgi:predicted phosphodiesterase